MRIEPLRTKSAAVCPSGTSSDTERPAFTRRSQTLTGLNVRAAPLAPPYAPAITRTMPASCGSDDARDLRVGDALVGRGCHLVAGPQVHPELHHLEGAALPRELRAVELLVQQARCRGHPLHVADADRAAAAGRVAVGHAACVDQRHGLEAAVRMRTDAALLRRGLEAGRPRVVHEQERGQLLRDVVVRKDAPHRETVADPVAAVAALDECQLFHLHLRVSQ